MTDPTPDQLILEHHKIDDWLKAEIKRFAEHVKPYKGRLEAIENQLLAFLNSTKQESCSTQYGTAYKSTPLNPGIENRDAFLDFVNEEWEAWGNEMLQLRAPQVEAVRTYMEQHAGALPPGLKVNPITRINIRRG